MPQDAQRPRNQRRSEDFSVVTNEPLPKDEMETPSDVLDFWGVHAERFKRGLTHEPIVVEHPKQTYTLSRGAHYFVIENIRTRSVMCITCPIRHGGILESHMLTQYKLEDGVLFYKGKAINKLPKKDIVDNALNKS